MDFAKQASMRVQGEGLDMLTGLTSLVLAFHAPWEVVPDGLAGLPGLRRLALIELDEKESCFELAEEVSNPDVTTCA